MIPKKIHRIWFGTKPIPERYDAFWEEMKQLHEGWEFTTWTYDNLMPLLNERIFLDVPKWARSCGVPMSRERATVVQQADVVGYEIIYSYGGIYVNCDIRSLKSFEPLLSAEAFVGMEDDYHICNAVMGGVSGHPFFKDLIEQLPERWRTHKQHGMEIATGPQYMTSVWRRGRYNLKVLPIEAFYPVHHGGLEWGEDNSDRVYEQAQGGDSYTVHSWGHRWQEGDLQ